MIEPEDEVIEYVCDEPFDPETMCHAPAVAVHIEKDAGVCLDHLFAQRAMPLDKLMADADRYWHGYEAY